MYYQSMLFLAYGVDDVLSNNSDTSYESSKKWPDCGPTQRMACIELSHECNLLIASASRLCNLDTAFRV
ncbi:hypothetical protein DAPPUDRAFT_237041 [Daphnia pulex]|uniref:Uncharacterized protein n=1 Tax=Daphnia pulex TaxID=6669 RepID=E9G2L9_DAPPU|nr:hypothetical protein DAPPUDRAFT_237041 [Daphnia pulex]|eukprot:EFX86280.1 hypothetical protein DAPPUDRAFT_237041 [Daphnia pulex]